ncbi:hypothetical protein GUJ93_ZPchr0002g25787 [Zizania palustris]|uniref:Uncharacterized protein n=1 Tax=Zizania palustris TaxID=103762 RepID=A0A8J5V398_ZIZPA|nr:hypothetical protein GUJ93_ZPchr0002g25787 [Zizania palustris]
MRFGESFSMRSSARVRHEHPGSSAIHGGMRKFWQGKRHCGARRSDRLGDVNEDAGHAQPKPLCPCLIVLALVSRRIIWCPCSLVPPSCTSVPLPHHHTLVAGGL